MAAPIIDTSVLIDVFLASADRHIQAKLLGELIIGRGERIPMPLHGLFEIASALKRQGMEGALQFNANIPETRPFPTQPVPIDEAFFEKYHDPSLPYTKAGDLIFLSIAKKDKRDLITEDKKLYRNAKAAGVSVFTIAEYLANNGVPV
jgi:predicted nucleic acid-binding protein